MDRSTCSLLSLFALAPALPGALLAGCDDGGAPEDPAFACRLAPRCEPAAPGPIDDAGQHAQFVVDSIRFGTGGPSVAHDVDCDGGPDNALGRRLGTVYALLSSDLDTLAAETVTSGRAVHLIDVQTTGFEDAADVGVRVFVGRDIDGQPGDNFSGLELFEVEAEIPSVAMAGEIVGGQLIAQYGEIPLQVPVPGADEVSTLALTATRVEGAMTQDRLELLVGGALPVSQLESGLLTLAHAAIVSVVEAECAGGVCPAGSRGEGLLSALDRDRDGAITFEELRESQLVRSLLQPDVDVLDSGGRINPSCDFDAESLSLAVAITAVPARFDLPR